MGGGEPSIKSSVKILFCFRWKAAEVPPRLLHQGRGEDLAGLHLLRGAQGWGGEGAKGDIQGT